MGPAAPTVASSSSGVTTRALHQLHVGSSPARQRCRHRQGCRPSARRGEGRSSCNCCCCCCTHLLQLRGGSLQGGQLVFEELVLVISLVQLRRLALELGMELQGRGGASTVADQGRRRRRGRKLGRRPGAACAGVQRRAVPSQHPVGISELACRGAAAEQAIQRNPRGAWAPTAPRTAPRDSAGRCCTLTRSAGVPWP